MLSVEYLSLQLLVAYAMQVCKQYKFIAHILFLKFPQFSLALPETFDTLKIGF